MVSEAFLKIMSATQTIPAIYEKKRGFLCGNHVLYCPDLSKGVSDKMPFYLYCATHNLMYAIDIPTQSEQFITDFPHGCKATIEKTRYSS
jgi:hypothetical protein